MHNNYFVCVYRVVGTKHSPLNSMIPTLGTVHLALLDDPELVASIHEVKFLHFTDFTEAKKVLGQVRTDLNEHLEDVCSGFSKFAFSAEDLGKVLQ